jgi:formylglycine-generating enzyme required for sulfatase activity
MSDHDPPDEHLVRRMTPRGRGVVGMVLTLAAPCVLIGIILGGRGVMPVKEMKLAPLVSFEAPKYGAPPPALAATPMVTVPAGTFSMGSTEKGESPVHSVDVAAFRLDPDEVTVADYRACVDANRCPADALTSLPGCNYGDRARDRHPMNCVDWNEAEIYCHWLGRRLPTEEEWEYAARGAAGRLYPWGNAAPDESRACFGRDATCPVGELTAGATPEGVRDLAGNVWEWTSSAYCPYDKPNCESAQRTVRGGSYTAKEGAKLRAALRSGHVVTLRERYLGFRCAK